MRSTRPRDASAPASRSTWPTSTSTRARRSGSRTTASSPSSAPRRGATSTSWTSGTPPTNVLATLDRRPEAYHAAIAAAAHHAANGSHDDPTAAVGPLAWKQEGLDRLLVYDRHPRKALVDHFYPADVTLHDLAGLPRRRARRLRHGGLSRQGPARPRTRRPGDGPARPGRRAPHPPAQDDLAGRRAVRPWTSTTSWKSFPKGVPLHFAVEINLAAMAGHAARPLLLRRLGDEARDARHPARPARRPAG